MPQSEFSTARSSRQLHPAPGVHPATVQFGCFAPDWHHALGHGLADFPRCLPLPAPATDLEPQLENLWPDFATFIEDSSGRYLMYYPAVPSPWSACVRFCVESESWRTQLYFDADPIT